MNKKAEKVELSDNCRARMQAVQDTMDVIGGKWKIKILTFLNFGPQHFMELQRRVTGIGSKMLSQELHDMEVNGLLKRTVCNTRPVTVEYELTEYGKTLRKLVSEMQNWGFKHRARTFRQDDHAEVIADEAIAM